MKSSTKYLLFGIGFGLLFPLIALIGDTVFIKELSFSWSSLVKTFKSSFLHYVIATAPIFLGASFYFAGFKADKMQSNYLALSRSNEKLLQMNKALDTFNYKVTHDLKTSMVEVESLALMIKKHADNESRREELTHRLITSSRNGAKIVNDFTFKVDDIRDEFNDLNSEDGNEHRLINLKLFL